MQRVPLHRGAGGAQQHSRRARRSVRAVHGVGGPLRAPTRRVFPRRRVVTHSRVSLDWLHGPYWLSSIGVLTAK
jgi:hypothetical protein